MKAEKSTLSNTILAIDPEAIKLDSQGRFEMAEIIDEHLLDGISGGQKIADPFNFICPITNSVAHCGGAAVKK